MTADMALTLSGLILEVVLVALLIWRGIHRTLPTFVGYIAVALCTDALASLVPRFLDPGLYLHFWIASVCLETLCFLGLILELGRNLLRQKRASPNWFLASVLFIPAVWTLTLLSPWTIPPDLPFIWRLEMRLSQMSAVLDLGAFLALVWWSALQRLHWPPREFRIAVGSGIGSLAALGAVIVHSHQPVGPAYHWVDFSASVVYLSLLIYWVQYFVFEDPSAVGSRDRAAQLASASDAHSHDRTNQMDAGDSTRYRRPTGISAP
jgi:hypothetical protein